MEKNVLPFSVSSLSLEKKEESFFYPTNESQGGSRHNRLKRSDQIKTNKLSTMGLHGTHTPIGKSDTAIIDSTIYRPLTTLMGRQCTHVPIGESTVVIPTIEISITPRYWGSWHSLPAHTIQYSWHLVHLISGRKMPTPTDKEANVKGLYGAYNRL